MLRHELERWQAGFRRLAGVDEAGRGPLAGPVVAAAVVLERNFAETEFAGRLRDLTDSKKISEAQRDRFCAILCAAPEVEWAVGMADATEIDACNILRATHAAMRRAVCGLARLPDLILVDGRPVPDLPTPSDAMVGGDGLSLSIAAASVIAKVTRDRLMRKLDRLHPQYGFARHKGYGTRLHMRALLEFGPCPEHRRSFRPVREAQEIRRRAQPATANPACSASR
jgi:ribonuclease HII